MKVLVTGGAGFIGSHIVDAIIEKGMEAVILDNLSTGRRENINPKAAFYQSDIRDKDISAIFQKEKPDVVCHHAAQVSVRNSVSDPCSDADINITGSINLMEASRISGVKKIVFASSGGAIYGEQEAFPATESHPTRPLSPYGAAKLSFEFYLNCYKEVYGGPYVALRYSNVYGPRQDPHGEAGVVAIFCGMMIKGETPTINGDGGQTRDYVYVKDVVAANIAAITGEAAGAFNIGTGLETSVNGLYEIIKMKTGYAGHAQNAPAKAGEQYRSVLDASHAGTGLGWRPSKALEVGIEETVSFFKGKLA